MADIGMENLAYRAGWLQGQLSEAKAVMERALKVVPKQETYLRGDLEHQIASIARTMDMIRAAGGYVDDGSLEKRD